MAGNTRKMAEARQQELNSKWEALAPSSIRAKKALYAAKDHNDTYTAYIADNELDEATNEVEEYSSCMLEAKRMFEEIRLMVKEINPEDSDLTVVKSIMEKMVIVIFIVQIPCQEFW